MTATAVSVGLAVLAASISRLRAQPRDLDALLDAKASLTVSDAPLEEAVNQLSAQVPGLNGAVTIRNTENVSATLMTHGLGVPVRDALRCIAALAGGNLYRVGDRLILGNPSDLTDEERSQAVIVGAAPADWRTRK